MARTRAELAALLTIYAADDYDSSQDVLIESIVDDAIAEVRNARYPNGYSNDAERERQEAEVMGRYMTNIRRIMKYHYDKIGKEGVTTFYEAGQTTTWESGGTPDSFFLGIVPVAKII